MAKPVKQKFSISLFLAIRLFFRFKFMHLFFFIQLFFLETFSLEPLES